MTIVDKLISSLETLRDRDELLTFLAPLRVPDCATDEERAKLTSAMIQAASRCWHHRGDHDE